MNASLPSIAFHEAFNARTLRPEEVARRFVPSESFRTLLRKSHSIVVGPRGSGKTTLLKMLQQPALEAWDHPDAAAYRALVDYTGIFVATDINWKTQIESLGPQDFTDEQHRLFSSAAFTTHVLRALVTAMLCRVATPPAPFPHRRADLTSDAEHSVVKEIAASIGLRPALPTLLSLKHALSQRLSRLREVASRERILGKDGRDSRLASETFLHAWYLESTVSAIEVFDDAIHESGAKWALLFDELELAPQWIREKLIASTRSVDDRLLFKLSLSPYDEKVIVGGMLSPMQDNDYDAIALWYPSREDGYAFANALWQSLLASHGHQGSAESTLGPSIFDTTSEGSGSGVSAYGPKSAHWRRFRELAAEDRTFAAYLADKHIDVETLHEGTERDRAAEIRKIISIVATRHTYRTPDGARRRQKVRSRKNPRLFVGAKSVFAMVEANPRWLIAIGSRLLEEIDDNGHIGEAVQNRELTKAANRFHAMLEAIPCLPPRSRGSISGVAELVKAIGEYFFKAVVLDDFNPDPPGSFTVDPSIEPALLDTVGKALNVGAIVYVPREAESVLVGSLVGKRFRLCYLLAAIYKFPIRLGREVSLSTIIRDMSGTMNEDEKQPGLFE